MLRGGEEEEEYIAQQTIDGARQAPPAHSSTGHPLESPLPRVTAVLTVPRQGKKRETAPTSSPLHASNGTSMIAASVGETT